MSGGGGKLGGIPAGGANPGGMGGIPGGGGGGGGGMGARALATGSLNIHGNDVWRELEKPCMPRNQGSSSKGR